MWYHRVLYTWTIYVLMVLLQYFQLMITLNHRLNSKRILHHSFYHMLQCGKDHMTNMYIQSGHARLVCDEVRPTRQEGITPEIC